jgi:CRP-like cAMP-binding protein
MEEVFYKKGDAIIEQDDIGDSFFVLEEGQVSVTRKTNPKDPLEAPRELARLGTNSYFGEISLLTAEPRSATITVLSDEAKCLRMTKMQFDSLLATTNQIIEENRKQIGQNVLEAVPLFKSMTLVNKRKLLEVMIPMTYMPGSYICRQGTTGNTFFILTEGSCKVTINSSEHDEKEVARLHPGDFFGEIALIEASNRRTANVISLESVSCLTLSRNDFNRLLKNFKIKIMEHQAMRSTKEQQSDSTAMQMKQLNTLASKRRVSGYNTIGQRDEVRISSLLRRLCTFLTESLWNSLYHRMYRDILLDSNHCHEYGKLASLIINSKQTRYEAVTEIQDQAVRILEMDPPRRSAAEHAFILGLLKQRNQLRDRLCKLWPPHQFALLAKKVKVQRYRYLRKIVEVDTKGTCAFIVLRGSVRIFTRVQRGDGHSANPNAAYSKTYYEEDLFPGDVFGEMALAGMHTRMITALSMTNVDLMVIEDEDYLSAQDRDSVHMGTEDKSKFLAQVPMFRTWDSYKLLRLAHVLVQEEIENNVVLARHRRVSKDLVFIVSGKVNILDSMRKKNIVTTLQPFDYFSESGFCNRFVKAINSKVTEEFYAVSASKLEILVLQESHFLLFDMSSVDLVRAAFLAKQSWRRERVKIMKLERAKVRKQLRIMNLEAAYLPQLRKQEEREKKLAEKQKRRDLGHDSDDDSNANEDLSEDDYDQPEAVGEYGGYTLYRPKQTLGGAEDRDHIFGASRPQTAGSVVAAESKTLSPKKLPNTKADIAYLSSLVHPLDSRLQNPMVWRPPPRPIDRLRNIEDIPVVLNKGFDLLMVTAACRDQRSLQKSQDLILAAKRPLTAKARMQKHETKIHPQSPNNFDSNASTASSTGTRSQFGGPAVVVISKMKQIMADQNIIDRRFHSEGNLDNSGTNSEQFVELTEDEEAALTDAERADYRCKMEVFKKKRASSNQFLRQSITSLMRPLSDAVHQQQQSPDARINPTTDGSRRLKSSVSDRNLKSKVRSDEGSISVGGGESQTEIDEDTNNMEDDDEVQFYIKSLQPAIQRQNSSPLPPRPSTASPGNNHRSSSKKVLPDMLQATTAAAAAGDVSGTNHPTGGRPMSARPASTRVTTSHTTFLRQRPTTAMPKVSTAMTPPVNTVGANIRVVKEYHYDEPFSADDELAGSRTVSATLSGKSTVLTPAARPASAVSPSSRRVSSYAAHNAVMAGNNMNDAAAPSTPSMTMNTNTGIVRASIRNKTSPFRRPPSQQPSLNPTENMQMNLPTIPQAKNRFAQGLEVVSVAQQKSRHTQFGIFDGASADGYPLRLLSSLEKASYCDSLEHATSRRSIHSGSGGGGGEGGGGGRCGGGRAPVIGHGAGMPTGALLNKARMAGGSPLLHERHPKR